MMNVKYYSCPRCLIQKCYQPADPPKGRRCPSRKNSIVTRISNRPYDPALGLATALETIAGQRGIQYNLTVVDARLQLFRERDNNIRNLASMIK
jgi:hypothetical protein